MLNSKFIEKNIFKCIYINQIIKSSIKSFSTYKSSSFQSDNKPKQKKSFLIERNNLKKEGENLILPKKNSNNNNSQTINVNIADTNISEIASNFSRKKTIEKIKIDENYACVYYKFPIEKEFNLFNLRNLLYAYIFVKQRNGKIYLNISDLASKANTQLKNENFEKLIKDLDWLDISLDFDDKLKDKLFESQRTDEYNKWLKFLIAQKDAYKCFCKNYVKCEGNCEDSNENQFENSEDFKSNSEIIYVRFKNQNKSYKYYDYMNDETKDFDSGSQGDFLLYKNFNGQFLDSFKRVIDDKIYSVTHIIEETKSFNPYKNAILTKHLLFSEKKYIELPNIKIKYWNKEEYDKLDISFLKSRLIIPEAVLNEAFMLGYSKKPAKDYKELLLNNKDSDVADWDKIVCEFDITNVSKIGSVFDYRRLLYLNKRNLVKKFIKSHESFKAKVFEEFKQNFKTVFEKSQNKFENWDHEDWRKIINLIIPSIISYEDIYTFYFLFESPLISAITKDNKKAIKGFLLDDDYKIDILNEITKLFLKIEKFDSKNIHKEISYFIFKKYQKDRSISSVNFYAFLKLIITGYADAPNLGDLCEIIGKKEVMERINNAKQLNKQIVVDNVKLLKEKKEKSILLLQSKTNINLISSTQTIKI